MWYQGRAKAHLDASRNSLDTAAARPRLPPIRPGEIECDESVTVAFMLTFEKAFDNFYANVWYLSGTENG
jgi:hypothetical protein